MCAQVMIQTIEVILGITQRAEAQTVARLCQFTAVLWYGQMFCNGSFLRSCVTSAAAARPKNAESVPPTTRSLNGISLCPEERGGQCPLFQKSD